MGRGHRLALRFREHGDGGIVSAKGRSLPQENFVPFIQTDVAINPGQFGRAAVQHERRGGRHQFADLQPHRRLMGLSFAIPIDVAMDIQSQLRAKRQGSAAAVSAW
jgi:serine protease Do